MKQIILCLLLLHFSNHVLAQQPVPDCNSFHTGEYLYTDSTGDTWELKRTKRQQVERNKRTGTIIRFRILWLNDCEYRLTQTWTNDRNHRKGNRTHFSYRIIRSTPNSFSYNCSCKNSPAIDGTVVRAMN
jgi:hypothetical protein